ncbi:MAG TPA: rhomboid family intramembrane serine protease [Candidatus Kapabacteria bacterium]|jgi:membrane associated rhomboid family serine protease|nr:rhomboid family intramembrane serine protease [Candidatus Kapabacteria bacterium]
MAELPPEDIPLAAVGRYQRFSEAQERGLVAAAMDLPYWVIREGHEFVLYVEEAASTSVESELAKFEAETILRRQSATVSPQELPRLESHSLFVAAAVISGFWALQNRVPERWTEQGEALNRAIIQGEWWRIFTALTLHRDFAHFVANLCFGLLFAGFLQPRLGGGAAWLGIVLSGAFGNYVNAWFYRSELHSSVGASTAVFGGLGLLMAWEFFARWRFPHSRGWWQLVVPLGGGLALLAFLGSGDEAAGNRTDYMAHFWGFASGTLIGAFAATRPRAGSAVQWLLAVAALALPILAWWLAIRA